jgi:hypothetical protein
MFKRFQFYAPRGSFSVPQSVDSYLRMLAISVHYLRQHQERLSTNNNGPPIGGPSIKVLWLSPLDLIELPRAKAFAFVVR